MDYKSLYSIAADCKSATTTTPQRSTEHPPRRNRRKGIKLPEESHTPNRYYVAFRKDGKDVKSIAKYGTDGKKIWEIHTNEHNGIKPHFHYWKGNGQEEQGHPLTPEMRDILNRIRNLK